MRLRPSPLPSLPAFIGGRRPVGHTVVTDDQVTPVLGTSNMKMARYGGGKYGGKKAQTSLFLFVPYADYITPQELRPMYSLMRVVVGDAKAMSQGGLSYPKLRKMGHPYGHGLRKRLGPMKGAKLGVSNYSIANKHRGVYESAWRFEINRRKGGFEPVLKNISGVAAFLAFGTSKMIAHGPQTTAMAMHLPQFRTMQKGLINKARARHNATEQMTVARLGVRALAG